MELTGRMERLLERFQGLVRAPRLNLIVFPALIGLLPMPGGAVFSAPMVKTLGQSFRLTPRELSYVNYWFRHLWEYWWPLYPGILLTTTLADIDLSLFILVCFPLTLVALGIGFIPLRKLESRSPAEESATGNSPPQVAYFLRELTPFLIVIGLGLGLGQVLSWAAGPGWKDISKEIGLILALLIAIGKVWISGPLTGAQRRKMLTQKSLLQMFSMVAAILVFKGILEDSRAVEAISRELMHWHIPLMPVTAILPFLVGAVVGITVAFVGTTFPILVSLIQTMGEGPWLAAYLMLALVSGFIGVLVSPLHLCFILSNEYFGTPMGPMYDLLKIPCTLMILAAVLYFFLLRLTPGLS